MTAKIRAAVTPAALQVVALLDAPACAAKMRAAVIPAALQDVALVDAPACLRRRSGLRPHLLVRASSSRRGASASDPQTSIHAVAFGGHSRVAGGRFGR